MRRIREVTAGEENYRLEPNGPFVTPRRDSVQPEPIGTIVLLPFRITGYDRDCDGSLMARLENLSLDELDATYDDGTPADGSGWDPTHIGLYSDGFVVTMDELKTLAKERPTP